MDETMKLMLEMNRAGLSIHFCTTDYEPSTGMLVRVVDEKTRRDNIISFGVSKRMLALYPEEALQRAHGYLKAIYKELRPDDVRHSDCPAGDVVG